MGERGGLPDGRLEPVEVGTVIEFDEHVGLGRVGNDDGAWAFHCTSIADGTRSIEPTTTVTFRIGPGGPGRWEAFDLRPEA